jgi:hypothetical protein
MICGVETPPFWQHYNFSGSSHLCIKAQLDGTPTRRLLGFYASMQGIHPVAC